MISLIFLNIALSNAEQLINWDSLKKQYLVYIQDPNKSNSDNLLKIIPPPGLSTKDRNKKWGEFLDVVSQQDNFSILENLVKKL